LKEKLAGIKPYFETISLYSGEKPKAKYIRQFIKIIKVTTIGNLLTPYSSLTGKKKNIIV